MKIITLALALAASTAMTGTANAAYTFNLAEADGYTVVTGSGSINLAGLTYTGEPYSSSSEFWPSYAGLGIGNFGYDTYYGLNGPATLGTAGRLQSHRRSGTGIMLYGSTSESMQALFGYYGDEGLLMVPNGYVSGSQLSYGTSSYIGTFAELGLTAGTYLYTWGSGADADSVTINIGPIASAVPEPDTWAMMLVGFGLIGATTRYRRRHSSVRYA